jgi:hypothetical protein
MEMSFAEELADATPAQRAEVERQVEAGFAEYLKDGAYHITAHARIGVGRRPAA